MPKPYFEDKNRRIQEIIMVNHAGEYGAQRIYQGQLAYTKDVRSKILIKNMLKQEREHLEYFNNQIKAGAARPTVLIPLWNIFGYSLGVFSARLGLKTAMLVTENIEKVIVEHYQKQIDYLEKIDKKNPLLKKIRKFKQDEADHIRIAVDNESQDAKFHVLLSVLVRCICRSAIFMSRKI